MMQQRSGGRRRAARIDFDRRGKGLIERRDEPSRLSAAKPIRARSVSAGDLTLAYASGSDRNPSEPEA